MIGVLQADGDACFRGEVACYCSFLDDFDYQATTESQEVLAALDRIRPDVLLLALDLKPLGGLALLQAIRSRWKSTELAVILLAVAACTEATLQRAADLGADYFMLRPVDLVLLEQRIRQLAGDGRAFLSLRQIQEVCIPYFELMGVPPHFKGYRYLLEGIWLAALHPCWLKAVTQRLYPAIGQRFEAAASQVERTMRYALEITWEKGDLEQLYRIFPHEVRASTGKPTTAVFISKMVDLVGLEIGQEAKTNHKYAY